MSSHDSGMTESSLNPEGQSSEPGTRHPTLWFDDGSIVLRVQTTLFCVHRTTLASHSTVFADMFTIPQPTQYQQLVDGRPTVDMPDNAMEFSAILRAIYDPQYNAAIMNEKENENGVPYEELAGIFRLSTKYHMPTLRRKCILRFGRAFPCTLKKYDDVGPMAGVFPMGVDTADALKLFRECDALEFLPVLYYFASSGDLENTCKRIARFPPDDALKCLIGREKLLLAQQAKIAPFFYRAQPTSNCQHYDQCRELCQGMLEVVWGDDDLVKDQNAFGDWSGFRILNPLPGGSTSYCPGCCLAYKEAFVLAREKLWEELPGYFLLGTWEEIRVADV